MIANRPAAQLQHIPDVLVTHFPQYAQTKTLSLPRGKTIDRFQRTTQFFVRDRPGERARRLVRSGGTHRVNLQRFTTERIQPASGQGRQTDVPCNLKDPTQEAGLVFQGANTHKDPAEDFLYQIVGIFRGKGVVSEIGSDPRCQLTNQLLERGLVAFAPLKTRYGQKYRFVHDSHPAESTEPSKTDG